MEIGWFAVTLLIIVLVSLFGIVFWDNIFNNKNKIK